MAKKLVIVESPAKASTIEKYLGKKEYTVKASMGHLRDLPKSQFGVDVENEFAPKYINVKGKAKLIKELQEASKTADMIYLATDPDREGEAISWHLATLLGIPENKPCRIEFHEITKTAITGAIQQARKIDLHMVDAQQTRRILDRIVGYKLSPLLWKKVRRGLSAGRVQSVAVRMICDREREIESFRTEEYWTMSAYLYSGKKTQVICADLVTIESKKAEILSSEIALGIKNELENLAYQVKSVKKRDRQRKPYAPFITSTLQQDSSHKLGFSAKKTMMLAQQLYESGHITYMRTDSARVASIAQEEARAFIIEKYGTSYVPNTAPIYAKKNAQDAHEAIRPTDTRFIPDSSVKALNRDQLRLYLLIWTRFVASQMAPAVYDTVTVDITAGRFGLRSTGSTLKFPGFIAVYGEPGDNDSVKESGGKLPALEVKQVLDLDHVTADQHFTEPPPRYNEPSLIKALEERGIGRPSTYAPIIETIQERGYVLRIEKRFHPTPLGFIVVDLLIESFPKIVDIEFTADMEAMLDEIAKGAASGKALLANFYGPFAETLVQVERELEKIQVPEETTDELCEKCGSNMVVKHGRFGSFLACPKFPECRSTKPIVKEIGVECPKCSGAILERKSRQGRIFFGCSQYPRCDYVTWNKPINERCQTCNSLMTVRTLRDGQVVKECGNKDCDSKPKSKARTSAADAKSVAPASKVSSKQSVAKKTKSNLSTKPSKLLNTVKATKKAPVKKTSTPKK